MSDFRTRIVVRSAVVLAVAAAFAIACSSSSSGGDDDSIVPQNDASTTDAPLGDENAIDAGDPTYVTDSQGILHGAWAGDAGTSIIRWKGIPFAQPPVGPLRWKAPAYPPAKYSGVRDATVYGNECLQPPADTDPTGAVSGDEDCLYLNVLAQATHAAPAPVIVFIHAEGFCRATPAMGNSSSQLLLIAAQSS